MDKIITGDDTDKREFTCSEVCYLMTKEERKKTGNDESVYCCCIYCDRVNNCDDVCDYLEDMKNEDNCEFKWLVDRCDYCGEIIGRYESSIRKVLVHSHGSTEDILICEKCAEENDIV